MAGKTKVYLSLIGAGFIGLAVDKFYFGASAPATTNAGELQTEVIKDEADGKAAPRARDPVKPGVPSKLSVPELHFPRNLPTYDPGYELRDVFSRMDIEGTEERAGKSAKEKTGKNAAVETIGREVFQASHRVDAVMVQESLKIALVDGRWVRVGDVVDSCKLTRIEGDSVYFECHDGGTELSPSGKRNHPTG